MERFTIKKKEIFSHEISVHCRIPLVYASNFSRIRGEKHTSAL